ncbi:PREDICTED: peritrophin-1 [Vollenhovia emeryi]|uniref:peritrophin-1 n=1 Tax=Vollenhovia emeryi TaxID=411798 RepID=UPI0005F4706A|nr:PREDICTED: peritrophin-1 [Vollenhovia emeryi]
MKGIYIIAIAFLASWAVSAAKVNQLAVSQLRDDCTVVTTVCPYPERCPDNTTTNLPHETDCTLFYKCDIGKGVLQKCPLMTEGDPVTRLHYNRQLQVCDWPWQAGCESCPVRNRDGTYPPTSRISYPHNNCGQYYECINGVPSLRTCPGGTCFSRTCQECVANREGGNCGPTIPTSPPPICTNPPGNNGDLRSHECDCGMYYTCRPSGLGWTDTDCQGGLHFSPTRKICLPPNEAGCLQ